MSFSPGARLGPYEILAAVGAGGMGEVYRARDPRLRRDVAIKVLSSGLSLSPERVRRFEQEARAAAALSHPNILAVFDIGQERLRPARGAGGERGEAAPPSASEREPSAKSAGGGAPAPGRTWGPASSEDVVAYIVSELLEGETLREKVSAGAMPVRKAVEYALQMAHGLEAAHEKGIVHRDLKPENIFVTADGRVKILDFGLAKLTESEPAVAGASALPTTPAVERAQIGPDTTPGVVLGTIGYMAPEQVRGAAADHRADVFAFGAILYEMLSGRRAFRGDTSIDTMTAILKEDPPDLPIADRQIPPALARIVDRCLAKSPSARFQSAADLAFALDGLSSGSGAADALKAAPPREKRARFAWTVATVFAIAFVGAAAAALIYVRRAPADAPETRTEIVTPATSEPLSFALSPDGRQLVFVASGDGPSRLWLRSLAGTASQPLAGTEGATYPFWSPASRSVGFFAGGQLKRTDLGGGSPQALANAVFARGGGTWNADGIVLFAPSNLGPLFRIPASGGETVAITKLDRQVNHQLPQFLPGGRQFLFYAAAPIPETRGIYLGSLDSEEVNRLTAADSAGMYAPSGWLLWVRAGTLVAQRLDLERRELAGDPVTVADQVGFDVNAGAFSVSGAGLVAYRQGTARRHQLIWFDGAGKALGTLGAPDETGLTGPRLSYDGRRVAVTRAAQDNLDIWLLDGARASRFTFAEGLDQWPFWSPDGSRIVFASIRNEKRHIYVKRSSGAGSEEHLLELPLETNSITNDWSADGRFVLYHSRSPQTDRDLWVLPLEGDRKPWLFLKTKFAEAAGQFSPDGRWVAYQSNESGRYEIYVRPFVEPAAGGVKPTDTGGQWQVSTAGGMFARWRPDGTELYYIAPDGQIMAAPITVTVATLEPGTPVALFQTRIYGGGTDNNLGRQYDVARDGRFLINTVLDDAASPITLIQNWKPPQK